jgi:hypothetical protein
MSARALAQATLDCATEWERVFPGRKARFHAVVLPTGEVKAYPILDKHETADLPLAMFEAMQRAEAALLEVPKASAMDVECEGKGGEGKKEEDPDVSAHHLPPPPPHPQLPPSLLKRGYSSVSHPLTWGLNASTLAPSPPKPSGVGALEATRAAHTWPTSLRSRAFPLHVPPLEHQYYQGHHEGGVLTHPPTGTTTTP